MRDENVQFAVNGEPGMGYLARPDSDAPALGVVVIQEWWGVNDHIRDLVRRYAEQGFVALAPDLFHGVVVAEPNDAQKQAMALDRPRAVKEIIGAVNYLKGLAYVSPKKIGVTGYCMGGGLALMSATQSDSVGAVVAFYGGGAPEAETFASNHAPILNILGEKDEWVTNNVKQIDSAWKQYSFPHDMVIYPGAEHAFFNDTRKEVYNPEASADAWNRARKWFRQYLTA